MTAALDLLARLESAGVKLALSESGEGLRVYGEGRPQPEVMAEVRAQKPALLAYLRGEDVGQPAPLSSSPVKGAHKVRPLPDWEAIIQEAGRCGSCARASDAPEWGPLMVFCSCPDVAFWPDRAPIAIHKGHGCMAYRVEGEEVGEGWRAKDTGKQWGLTPSLEADQSGAGLRAAYQSGQAGRRRQAGGPGLFPSPL